jgi:hypothetical protein
MSRSKSSYVMVVYWKEGGHARFYSRDEKKSKEQVKQKAITKLLTKLKQDYACKYITALIYTNEPTGGELIHKFVDGKQII